MSEKTLFCSHMPCPRLLSRSGDSSYSRYDTDANLRTQKIFNASMKQLCYEILWTFSLLFLFVPCIKNSDGPLQAQRFVSNVSLYSFACSRFLNRIFSCYFKINVRLTEVSIKNVWRSYFKFIISFESFPFWKLSFLCQRKKSHVCC